MTFDVIYSLIKKKSLKQDILSLSKYSELFPNMEDIFSIKRNLSYLCKNAKSKKRILAEKIKYIAMDISKVLEKNLKGLKYFNYINE